MRDLSEIAGPPELSDGRVRLRRVLEKDRAAVVRALNDPVSARFLARPPFPYLDEHFDEWLELAASGRGLHEARAVHWSIADAGDDFYLGGASLEITEWREAGEIGYQVAPWARGRGVATAAARLIRDWAFDHLALARLEIAADVDNIASQRVAQAAGFAREGVARGYIDARVFLGPNADVRRERRDHVLFGMLRDDPRAPAAPVPWPRLGDGVVVVRAFETDDAAAVAAACHDPHMARWIFRLPAPYALADAEGFIARARRGLASGEQIRLAVVGRATGDLLGSVSLEPCWQLESAELGYWVKREARRRGVATAAARLVIRWAFEELGLERIELQTYPGNLASQRLAESLGFRREGLLRGVLPAEPGKDRSGRVSLGSAGTAGPPLANESPSRPGVAGTQTPDAAPGAAASSRDDQVLFALLGDEWTATHGR